jgi:hypothetical protein
MTPIGHRSFSSFRGKDEEGKKRVARIFTTDTRVSANNSGNLGTWRSVEGFDSSLSEQAEGRLLREERERTHQTVSLYGREAERKDSGVSGSFRKIIGKITNAPPEYDPDDDPIVEKHKELRRKIDRIDPAKIMEEAILPRR